MFMWPLSSKPLICLSAYILIIKLNIKHFYKGNCIKYFQSFNVNRDQRLYHILKFG